METEQKQALTATVIADTARPELDRALETLSANKDEWARLPIAERIALLDAIKVGFGRVEQRWVNASLAAKGARSETMAEGEEWVTLTVTYRLLGYLRKALRDIEKHGQPHLPGRVCWKDAGRWTVNVFPQNLRDRMAMPGIHAEVWVYDDYKGDVPPMGAFYRQKDPAGKLGLVLGAGNIASQVTYDILHKLFVEGQAVLLKMNPVNAYLGELLEEAMAALKERGFFAVVHGGAAVGAYLSQHELVDAVHLTGSDRTYEAVVFGPGAEGQKRKAERKPLLNKPVSAELGNVSPVIVVPGPWSDKDVKVQAAKMGTWLVPNAGFNCITPRVFIQMQGWERREELTSEMSKYLETIETRTAYYPGSAQLHGQFVAEHPDAKQLGAVKEGQLPWTFITGVDASNADDICFRREPFFSLFSETALPAENVVDFIEKAVKFANSGLWGSLAASIVVHPKSLKDPAVKAAVDKAIEDLKYGSVVINHWGALAYYMATTPWGGAPGSDMYDIQSGVGVVNNPLMFDRPIKSVVRAPFISMPDPYFAHSKRSYAYYRQDTRYTVNPTIPNLIKLLWTAIRS
jgi:acyl-CoA reductase-like NAD-dependent aldehyde dehydrogenase